MLKSTKGEPSRVYSLSWVFSIPDPQNNPNARVWHLGINERTVDIASFAFNPELNLTEDNEAMIINNMTQHFVENVNLDAVMGILYHSTTH